METSFFIVQVLSICYLSIGLGFLVSKDYYKKEFIKLPGNPWFVLLSGYFAIMIGMLILYIQDIGNSEWKTALTIIWWIATVKGVLFIVFPKMMSQYAVSLHTKHYNWIGALIIGLGLVLGYFGFIV